MSSCLLAASPSWYSSRVSDCSEDGHFVFGAKNSLYLLNISQKEPSFTDQIVAHQERVVSLSLCHVPGETHKCVTTSEDGKVRIWDLQTKALLQEHTEHQGQPTAVHWSPIDSNLIVSGDDKGLVVTWQIDGNSRKLLSPDNGHIFCVTCSPHNRDHVAVGYKSGNIILADISRRGVILQRLRGHDEEIHSLCWCPVTGESLSDHTESAAGESASGSLLISGSRDRSIKVWSTSDGRNLMTLKLPTNTGHKRDRYEEQNRNRAWLTLCWPQNRPMQFMSSTYNGDLLLWDLTRSGKQKWETFSAVEVKGHNRIVFNVSSLPPSHDLACSISMDRQIVLWNLDNLEAVHKVSTLGGFVYNIAASPLNPNRLALGVGDNMIRVCNMNTPTNVLDTVTLWQGIKSKVTTLSWHPVKEGHLAYGTDDGRVGIYDVLSQKAPFVSSTYHKRTVYVVAWGPPCPRPDNETGNPAYCLYSCGDGTILQHDPYKFERPAIDMNKVISKANGMQKCPSRSEISFKPDWLSMAIGNEDGSVDVYSVPNLKLKCSIQVHRKLVNALRWHPEFTAQSGDASPCRSWLAIATNECFISVIDLQTILEVETDSCDKNLRHITESMCRLEGHSNRITGLSWSSHKEAQLVSASYDGSAQVWDVRNVQPLANYRGHSGRLFCAQWSLTDPDIIYTGADDFSVHSWHVAGQEYNVPPKGKDWTKKKKGKGKSKVKKDRESNQPASGVIDSSAKPESNEMDTLKSLLAAKKKELEMQEKTDATLPESPEQENGDVQDETDNISTEEETSPVSESLLKESVPVQSKPESNKSKTNTRILDQKKVSDGTNRRKRRERSMFPVFNTMETRGKAAVQQDTMDLASLLYCEEDGQRYIQLNENQTHLGLFTERTGLFQHLDAEEKHHNDHGNSDQVLLLHLWKGDLGDTLKQAGAKRQLNDWHLAMAPSVSPKLWREMCVLYAKQLEDDGFLHKAASYYLNVHKVHDAVEMFSRHNQYKDALSLALARLPKEDPILEKLYAAWAVHLLQENSYEQAAQCYLALRKPTEAALVLARRSDNQSLRAATHLALVSGEMSTFKNFATRYTQECLIVGDWQSASEVVSWHDSLKGLALYTTTHELLCQEFQRLNVFATPLVEDPKYSSAGNSDGVDSKIPKFLLDPHIKDKLSTWQAATREGQPLVHQILGKWCLYNKDNLTNEKLLHYIKELSEMVELKQASVAVKQVIQSISLQISIGMLCLLLCDKEESAHWWTVAMSTCKEAQHPEMLIALCKLLLPQGPEKFVDLQQQVTAIRLSATESAVGVGPAVPKEAAGINADDPKDGKDTLVNASRFCTSYDCMVAFYSYSVILDEVENHKEPEITERTSQAAMKDCMSESLETFDVLEENINHSSESDASKPKIGTSITGCASTIQHLSESQIEHLSQNLLWNNQVKKLELTESLTFIQKAMKGMISKHNVQHSSNCVERDTTSADYIGTAEPSKVLLTPPSICRSISGEYLHMKPGCASFKRSPFASPKQSPKRLFSPECSSSRKRADSEGHEEMMPSIEENGSSVVSDGSSLDTMSHSGILQTQIYTKAHNIFSSDMSESINADVENSGTMEPEHSGETVHNVGALSISGNDKNIEENGHNRSVENQSNQPLEIRYCGEDVTLSVLSDENQRVTAELHNVTCMMKSTPFPHPLESAKLLCQLLLHQPVKQTEMLKTVCQWAVDRAYLSEHQLFFSTLLPD